MENNTIIENANNALSTGMIMDAVTNTGGSTETSQEAVNNAIMNSPGFDPRMFLPRKPKQMVRKYDKIRRNDLCPCGSGLKYKHCCLDSGKYEGIVVKGTEIDETTED